MNTSLRVKVINFTFLFLFSYVAFIAPGCTPEPPRDISKNENPKAELPPVKAVTIPAPPEPAKTDSNWLAELKESIKNVDYRLHSELIWKKAVIGDTFGRFDALQTQDSSQAKILYKSGSQLEVKANTLIVFDHDPGLTKKTREDRIIVKSGELTGTTKTELWVFTNAGLVQLKGAANKKTLARAKISIKDGKKLNVKLDSGTADLIYVKDKDYAKLQIAANSDVEIVSQQPLFSANAAPDEKKILEITQAAASVKAPMKTELVIESPQDGLNTSTKVYEVKGHLTELGGKLIINGELITLDSDLKFVKKIELSEGANLIVFQLIRTDATVEFFRRSIKLNKQQ